MNEAQIEQVKARARKLIDSLRHYGDPCVHCGIPHDDVPPGPCLGDSAKAIPMAWCSLGIRWDGVAHYRIKMSDGTITDRWEWPSMNLPSTYLRNARYDEHLRRE